MGHLILQLCWTYMMSLLNSRTCSTLVSRQTIEYQQQLYSTSVLANFLFAYNLVMNDYLHYKPIILVLGEIYTCYIYRQCMARNKKLFKEPKDVNISKIGSSRRETKIIMG